MNRQLNYRQNQQLQSPFQPENLQMSAKHPPQLPKDNKEFPSDQLKLIRSSFTFRYKIEEALNKFQFKETNTYLENVASLSEGLSNAIDLESSLKTKFLESFSEFLSAQQNIPIQVNIKKIRYEQMTYLIDQWEHSMHESSLLRHPERLYSIQHRNILFSRVFYEQKQNIQEYFETLSQKKMLKGVDIYQLLVDVLSHYFLYEFSCDNQTFFQKINSFNNFLQIVDRFTNSESRIIIDNKSKDFEYIKLYEFEALIYFWQSINPELELRSDRRYNSSSKEVQTEQNQMLLKTHIETQTIEQKEKVQSLEETINNTLKQLNRLTEEEGDPERLQIIQDICEALRKEKIKLSHFEKSKSIKKGSELSPYNLHLSSQYQRFLDINSDQSDLELRKTQRISMKAPPSPQLKKGLSSKRKYQKDNSQEKQSKQYYRHPKDRQDTQQIEKQQHPQTKLSRNHLQLDNIMTYSEQIDDHIELRRIDTESTNGNNILNSFEIIYEHYSNRNTGYMDLEKLNRFFIDIGIIQEKQSIFDLKILRKHQIKDTNRIKQVQFLEMMGLVMKQDQDLTFDVIAQFVDLYICKPAQKSIESKIMNYNNNQSISSNNARTSQNRYNNIPQTQVKRQLQSYKNSSQKMSSSPSYNRVPSYSREGHLEKQSKRKRYAYCQDTPKFQNQGPYNRFTESRGHLSRQKKTSLPVPSYRIGYDKKY